MLSWASHRALTNRSTRPVQRRGARVRRSRELAPAARVERFHRPVSSDVRPHMQHTRTVRGVVLSVVAIAGCFGGPVVVTVSNRSAAALENVVVSGSGLSEPVGTCPPGSQRSVPLRPVGEAAIGIAFEVAGKHYGSAEQAYIESSGGYRVVFVVQPDFKVTVSTEVKG